MKMCSMISAPGNKHERGLDKINRCSMI